MAPKQKDSIVQVTVRLDRDIPEQARALAIYEELLTYHPRAKSLGTLLPDVLTILADIARDHPALSNRTARLIAKHQDKVMELLRRLEAGEQVPGFEEVSSPPPARAKPMPLASPPPAVLSNGSGGDIEIDFSQLEG